MSRKLGRERQQVTAASSMADAMASTGQ